MSLERPWEAGPFDGWVIQELNQRTQNLSTGIIQSPTSNNDMNYTSGPRRHWIRAFSNGLNTNVDENSRWGLILKSPNFTFDLFSTRYGISPNEQVYGFSNDNDPKFIKNPQYRINVPEPGITSFTVDVQKNFYITAKLNWVCHSVDQLKAITPYFLTPLTTIFVEWGWNNFNVGSLIDYNNVNDLTKIIDNHFEHYQNKVPLSKGNYDFMVGDILNFEYMLEENIIRGFTEIRSKQMLYTGFNIRGSKTVNTANTQNSESPVVGFKSTCEQILNALKYSSRNLQTPVVNSAEIENSITDDQRKRSEQGLNILKGLLDPKKYGKDLSNISEYIYKYVTTSKSTGNVTQYLTNQNSSISDVYITLELFVDIMNSLKNQGNNSSNPNLKKYFEMDVINTKVNYHKNLISTSRNVLIPNPNAPKFNGKDSLSYTQHADSTTKFFGESDPITNIASERGQYLDGRSMKREDLTGPITLNNYKNFNPDPNIQLALLVIYNDKYVYRNDLDYVLNGYGRDYGGENNQRLRTKTSFDAEGLLKNIYINLNFIQDSIITDDDIINMSDVYNTILKEINESVCDFWNLEIDNVTSGDPNDTKIVNNRLQIVDKKYITKDKNTQFNNIYDFEYGSNKSIIKKINFTTSLTNAMANQILYRSFGEKSLSTNNLLDFTNGGQYVDRIKGSYRNQSKPRNSETLMTFLNLIDKYLKFSPSSPDANFLMRVQVFPETKTEKRQVTPTTESGNPVPDLFGAALSALRIVPSTSQEVTITNYNKYNIVDLCIPDKEALVYLLNDNDLKGNPGVYCAPIRNIEIEISLMGIAGIKVFQYFKIKNLPPPFTDDIVVFQVRDVNHTVDENGWETRIKASVRPAYNLLPV